jgi:hypothetical protein
MLTQNDLNALRLQLSVKAKNGIDFIVAASIIWSVITVVWMQPNLPSKNGFITFLIGGVMLPLAWSFSKVFKTNWTIRENPLQPLGLWLNFAQLFYFPFLVFIYSKQPQHIIMTYGIITGAHFFPYAWFYNVKAFAVMAGVISVGCMCLGLRVTPQHLYFIPLFVAGSLVVLSVLLAVSYKKNALMLPESAPAISEAVASF